MFGTEAQKQKYLPGLVSGEMVGAYCLSESGSGSDSLGAKTRAMRQADGSFVLSGEKMWITNGGFADVYVVFAKVDGEHFTAFIVERAWPGVSSGKEEHKMGLHGSSTTPVILQDVKVPADAVLGEIGKGHKVAFNVLNFGRFKLGAMCSGGARAAIGEATKYAVDAQAVRHADRHLRRHQAQARRDDRAAVRAREHAVSHRRPDRRAASSASRPWHGDGEPMLQALEEFAVEASIAKVLGSEVIDYILDENVQIHGGNGFVRDYPAEGHYRDARVNRIFEGTNEINRLLIPGMLMKKALKGDLPLIAAAKRLQDEIMSPSLSVPDDDGDARWPRRARAVGGVQEGGADAGRHRDAALRREAPGRAGGAHLPRRHPDRHLRQRERAAARAPCGAADDECRPQICRPTRPASTCTKPRGASSWPRARAWRRWPRATCCARSWRRCAGCSRSRRPTPSRCGAGWRTRRSPRAGICSTERAVGRASRSSGRWPVAS